ncbi:MAG: GNAT family N-acetyltransferase [Oscillospiraceae bacterium]|nr:GNAT family N-acetyltransferase [Oscillospiraceae bacterium]
MSLELKLANGTPGALSEIKTLFGEYTGYLCQTDPGFARFLCMQNYDDELENLDAKYALPGGRLYIAYLGNQAAGCIALRKMSETQCEMKRLYVRPEFRGAGVAKALAEQIIADAKALSYRSIWLDTLPVLGEAIKLYEKLGFARCESYNNSPIAGAVFMKREI